MDGWARDREGNAGSGRPDMFQQANNSQAAATLPRNCTIEESDWRILSSFWHPVAFAHDVTDKPLHAKLLDVELVVYRTSGGIAVARDLCPHRGARLSLGRIVNDRLVCPMHGLHFDHTGKCTRIPSIPDPNATIPDKLCLQSYLSTEHYGIVWTCLSGKPAWQLPTWEGISNPDFKKLYLPHDTWLTSAPRHVENFNDIAHFPWVHTHSFGGDEDAASPPYKVEHTDYGLTFAVSYDENFNRFPDGVPGNQRHVTYTYELTYPFSTIIKVAPAGSGFVHFFGDTVCPVSANETRIFQLCTDTTGNPDRSLWLKDGIIINSEDKPIVEGQHPEELPLDLRDEVHIPADRMSLEYRRALVKKFGLGAWAR